MAYTKQDLICVADILCCRPSQYRTKTEIREELSSIVNSRDVPCNVLFSEALVFAHLKTQGQFEALLAVLRKAKRNDEAPAFGFSITEKEAGWEVVNSYIKLHPERFQTIVTPSRHGKYKVMWVIGK